MFRHLRSIVKPKLTGGLSKLLVPRNVHATTSSTAFSTILAETAPEELVWDHQKVGFVNYVIIC
jgi:hypothetical protein